MYKLLNSWRSPAKRRLIANELFSKEQYYNQQGPKENWEYLSHKHKLAKQRKI